MAGVATPLGSSLLQVSLSLTMTVREALVALVSSTLISSGINGTLCTLTGWLSNLHQQDLLTQLLKLGASP